MPTFHHGELLAKQIVEGEFWLDPYIPKKSTVFLWGDTSIGKSPLTWAMAKAVASGTSFYGLPVKQGKVLYLEVDTSLVVNAPRIQKLRSAGNEEWGKDLVWIFDENFSVPPMDHMKSEDREKLIVLEAKHHPKLVIVNTVRKVHGMDDKDSRTPAVVYQFFRKIFPSATVLFVHHERKRSTDPNARSVEAESFSGSKAWINDATVGLHLQSYRAPHGKANLRLLHHKSQASEKVRQLELMLSDDGTNLGCYIFDEYMRVYEALNEDSGSTERRKFDQAIATELGISAVSARRRRLDIERGRWPHTRSWIGRQYKGRKNKEEEAEEAETEPDDA